MIIRTTNFLIVLCVFLLSITSCDDPIVSNGNYDARFDSSRYVWRIDTLSLNGLGMCVTDTGNYTILHGRWMSQYKNGTYTRIFFPDQSIFAETIFQNKDNIVYLGGNKYNGIKVHPAVYKWDGNVFKELDLKLDSLTPYFPLYSMQCISSDNSGNIWMGTSKGDIIRYDGSSCLYYKIDTSYRIRNFFYDENNDFNAELIHFSSSGNEAPKHAIYKFDGTSWNKIFFYEDILSAALVTFKLDKSLYAFKENKIVKSKDDGVYIFKNGAFEKAFDFLRYQIDKIEYAGGAALNNFAINGYIANTPVYDYPQYLFHWNGNRFSKEFRFRGSLVNSVARDFKISGNYLFVLYETSNITFLMKGVLK